MLAVDRRNFVRSSDKLLAYDDTPLQIGQGQTISAPHMVVMMLEELNLDKDEIISGVKSSDIENKYFENTNAARENKIFGSPSFIVKNELFWGDDRMEDAIKWSLK